MVVGRYWFGKGKVCWASELCRQAGAPHVLCCRTFSRACSSFTHCLQCFDTVHYELWSGGLALNYLASSTVWYVHLFLWSCSKHAACLNMLQSQRKPVALTASMFALCDCCSASVSSRIWYSAPTAAAVLRYQSRR